MIIYEKYLSWSLNIEGLVPAHAAHLVLGIFPKNTGARWYFQKRKETVSRDFRPLLFSIKL